MILLVTSPLTAFPLGWIALSLSLAPLSALAATRTVEVNGTTIVGTSQTFSDNITVEFFGGEYSGDLESATRRRSSLRLILSFYPRDTICESHPSRSCALPRQ